MPILRLWVRFRIWDLGLWVMYLTKPLTPNPNMAGKVGTDIQDKKCSWLCVQTLQRGTPAQLKVLEDNYGQWDDAKVANVKALYNELKLKEEFEKYEEESYQVRSPEPRIWFRQGFRDLGFTW